MGGQGAPLVPLYHAALARPAGLAAPLLVLNLGGVGNVTYIGARDDDLRAFDTGPGNALIDDWLRCHTGAAHDAGGALAATGRVDEAALAALMAHAYFAAPPPKREEEHTCELQSLRRISYAVICSTKNKR